MTFRVVRPALDGGAAGYELHGPYRSFRQRHQNRRCKRPDWPRKEKGLYVLQAGVDHHYFWLKTWKETRMKYLVAWGLGVPGVLIVHTETVSTRG